MHYWKALAFLRTRLEVNQITDLSLDEFTEALGCTRRNAQLIVKKLVNEKWIEWQSGVGRGNLPKITLLNCLNDTLQHRADALLADNKVEQALELVDKHKRDLFLRGYIDRYEASPDKLDILQIPFYRGTHCLDPIYVSRRTESHITSYLYSNLLRFDAKQQAFVGDLAMYWYREGNTWHFILRKGLVFHDGSTILAQAIKNHFLRLINANHQNSQQFHCISNIIVISPLHIAFETNAYSGYLEGLVSSSAAGITKVHDKRVIGSGSFELTEQTQWLTRLTAFRHYHGLRPWVDGVEMWNIGDQAKDFELHCDIINAHQHYQSTDALEFQESEQWERGCEYALINPKGNTWLSEPSNCEQLSELLLLLCLQQSLIVGDIKPAKGMLSTLRSNTLDANVLPNANLVAHDCPSSLAKNMSTPKQALKILTYQLYHHIEVAEYYCKQLNLLGFPCEFEVLEFPEFCLPESLEQADIIISGEVFSDNLDRSWMGWLLGTSALTTCLTDDKQTWLHQQIEHVWTLSDHQQRQTAFLEIEQQLINAGIYRPIFHVKQQLNQAETVNPMELLANGWIDFNQVTMRK